MDINLIFAKKILDMEKAFSDSSKDDLKQDIHELFKNRQQN